MTRKILSLLCLTAMIAPAASFAQPAFRQPDQVQTDYGQRQYGQPQQAQTGYGQPEHAQPGYAQLEHAQPGYAQLEHGAPPAHVQPNNWHPEPNPGPHYDHPPAPPQGWNLRPQNVDRDEDRHNFEARRDFHIGPYFPPAGFAWRHWGYGEILPRAYWTADYLIADYWRFALQAPPPGFEWVRCGPDALLLNIVTGEILQAQYGVFA